MIIQIEPWIDEEEMFQLRRVVDSTYVTEGALTSEFEEKIRHLTGANHAIAMTNGTLALYACLKSLGIGPGDEVIVPDMTFIASANAVIMAGAMPRFCDIRRDTYCIDMDAAQELVTPRTRAVMPVHLYGQAADLTSVMTFAKQHELFVVEDAAQGVGVRFNNQHVGTFGDLGILSFYGNKTITCGEGGIILTNDEDLARACYRLKNHGRDRKGIFVHDEIGFNFSFTEMQAAIGIAQMNKLERIIKRKNEIRDRYVRELAGVSQLTPCAIDSQTTPVHWFSSFESKSCDALAAFLLEKGIQTRRFFYPLHLQPCYRKDPAIREANIGNFPVSAEVYRVGISLPSSYLLKDAEQDQVIEATKAFHELGL